MTTILYDRTKFSMADCEAIMGCVSSIKDANYIGWQPGDQKPCIHNLIPGPIYLVGLTTDCLLNYTEAYDNKYVHRVVTVSLMVRCCQCKWWGNDSDDVGPYKMCDNPRVHDMEYHADGFGVREGEPYNAGTFCTGPKFGCVHGQTRDEQH